MKGFGRDTILLPLLVVLGGASVAFVVAGWVDSMSSAPLIVEVPKTYGVPADEQRVEGSGGTSEADRLEGLDVSSSAEIRDLVEAGRFTEAERLLNEQLTETPDAPEVEHDLAVLALRRGRPDQAIPALESIVARRPGWPSARYHLALALSRTGRKDEAKEAYSRILEMHPDHADANNNLGLLLLDDGDLEGARAYLTRAAAASGGQTASRVNFNLGLVLSSLGDVEAAEERFRRAIDLDPPYVKPRMSLALLEGNDPKGLATAKALYEEVLRLEPDYAPAHYNLGIVLSDLKEVGPARKSFRRAIELDPGFVKPRMSLALLEGNDPEGLATAKALYEELLRLDAGYAPAHYNLGIVLSALGEIEPARESFRRAIEFDSTFIKPRMNLASLESDDREGLAAAQSLYEEVLRLEPDYASAHYSLGVIAQKREDLTGAIERYRRAIAIWPDYGDAHFNLALAYLDQGRLDKSEHEVEWLLENGPDDPRGPFNAGRIAFARAEYRSSVAHYDRALALSHDDYAEAWINRGLALTRLGDRDAAVASYGKALELEPDNQVALYNLALVYLDSDQWNDAERSARRSLDVGPEHAESWFVLARALAEMERTDDAMAAYDKALERRSDYLKAYVNLGILYSRAAEYERAVDLYRRAIANDARYVPAWYNLGVALRKLGRVDEAIDVYATLLDLDPESTNGYLNLGVLFSRKGEHRRAAELFEEGLLYEPSDTALRFNLALQHYRMDDLDQAERELKAVLRLRPEYAKAWRQLIELRTRTGDTAGVTEAKTALASIPHPEAPSANQ